MTTSYKSLWSTCFTRREYLGTLSGVPPSPSFCTSISPLTTGSSVSVVGRGLVSGLETCTGGGNGLDALVQDKNRRTLSPPLDPAPLIHRSEPFKSSWSPILRFSDSSFPLLLPDDPRPPLTSRWGLGKSYRRDDRKSTNGDTGDLIRSLYHRVPDSTSLLSKTGQGNV